MGKLRYDIKLYLLMILAIGLAWGLVACTTVETITGGKKESAEPKPEPSPGQAAKGAPEYWLSMATYNQVMPGASSDPGLMGKIIGKVTGMKAGRYRSLRLQLTSKPVVDQPEATHDIPAGMKMGETLPLASPKSETKPYVGQSESEKESWKKEEPPKTKIKFYWGCGEKAAKGQPRVVSTSGMSPTGFANLMAGRKIRHHVLPVPRSGWIYAEWPNRILDRDVPLDASLQGQHFVHGNYIPHIKFSLEPSQDFLAPVEFTSIQGGIKDTIRLQWSSIPQAIGYFALAMGTEEKTGDLIIWSSSRVYYPGWGLLDYLPSREVRRLIGSGVVMPPSSTDCIIPDGIFAETKGAMLQFIAWGKDVFLSYPAKAKLPDWRVRARYKSTGMLILGEDMAEQNRPTEEEQEKKSGVRRFLKIFK